jgi:hypothetical protein
MSALSPSQARQVFDVEHGAAAQTAQSERTEVDPVVAKIRGNVLVTLGISGLSIAAAALTLQTESDPKLRNLGIATLAVQATALISRLVGACAHDPRTMASYSPRGSDAIGFFGNVLGAVCAGFLANHNETIHSVQGRVGIASAVLSSVEAARLLDHFRYYNSH